MRSISLADPFALPIDLRAQTHRVKRAFIEDDIKRAPRPRFRTHDIPDLELDPVHLGLDTHNPPRQLHARHRIIQPRHPPGEPALLPQPHQHLSIARAQVQERGLGSREVETRRGQVGEDLGGGERVREPGRARVGRVQNMCVKVGRVG